MLRAHGEEWLVTLQRLLKETKHTLRNVKRRKDTPEKELVLADFEGQRDRIEQALARLEAGEDDVAPSVEDEEETATGQAEAEAEIGADAVPQPRVRARSRESVREPRTRARRPPEERDAPEPRGDGERTRVRARIRETPPARDPERRRSEPRAEPEREPEPEPERPLDGTPQLQLSWHEGRIVAWSAAVDAVAEDLDAVRGRLKGAGTDPTAWVEHDAVRLPGGREAPAIAAPVQQTLGWLVSLAATATEDTLGPSATWLGLVASLGARLVGAGRVVPQLDRLGGPSGGKGNRGTYRVRWYPALVDHDELTALTRAMPASVAAFQRNVDGRAVTMELLGAFVDAVCADAASRVPVPAAPPDPRSAVDVAESILARLDGTTFEAPTQHAGELIRGLQRWASTVIGSPRLRLVAQLDPPDDSGAWHLKVLVPGGQRRMERVDAAMSNANPDRREHIKGELERLEALFPRLQPRNGRRRGEVLLGQQEAWELMTETGPMLVAAGFEVRVPPLKRRKARPGLRITATEGQETVVGAQQLSSVQWSAVFDDVELTAEEITRLAAESRPLVKSHGRWVEVDHADLEAAAAALAEREEQAQLTGADMLRYALGLEESPFGSISVAGEGWAADLLRSASEIPQHPPTSPEGFEGELRGYQADALAWLRFLDRAGLGGCLALDMGLGKTPTMLAHLRQTTDQGTSLVIAPPAVVGNWASEARKFVPDLKVMVHHGANRTDVGDIADEVADVDVVITTYGTAVRDISELADINWGKVVLDEAQVIKNHTSETAQQLRRLEARTRVVLTGTPIENGLGDLWALLDFANPGLLGGRSAFISQMSRAGDAKSSAEQALRTLNGVLVFRRTKAEPAIAAELPDRIDELDHCPMTPEQVGLYQAVLDELVIASSDQEGPKKKGAVLAAITALKQICNHPAAYTGDDGPLEGRSGKLARLIEIVESVFQSDERVLIFTHFASWGERLAEHLTERTGQPVHCYHGGLARGARDRMIKEFQEGEGAGALVLSLKAGGTGLNLTAASHVVLYDRWWNPAVEDQARDRAWRIGQTRTVVSHRLVCPGTVDERVEEVVAGKRRIADMALPKSSSVGDLDSDQLRAALGIDAEALLVDEEAVSPEPASRGGGR
ncbi:MAG: hypothetical protein KY461_02630 [Actinobacteria bacterium]|nr:hypothetical protein [Actinomycetota bacterium]